MISETWRDIKGYEGYYQVSDLGRVRLIDRSLIAAKLISIGIGGRGYQRVNLSKGGISTGIYVHRLVAQAFIANPNNLCQVNHKDWNKKNNNVSNLEYVAPRENVFHSKLNRKRTSLYAGVCWHRASKKWQTNIIVDKKKHYLGLFETELDAAKAHAAFCVKHNIRNRYMLQVSVEESVNH
jgi:hypothetical protein